MSAIAIIGTGLIGGSIGLAIKSAAPNIAVQVFDADPAAASRAVERGAADAAFTTAREAVSGCDVVFIATPVRAIAGVAREIAGAMTPAAVITDVGSTKSRVVIELGGILGEGSFIGGHPMAGSEEDGIEAARADLFREAWWILTPTTHAETTAYRRLHALVTTFGARVLALDPAQHDALMAVVSHLPHLTATALMGMAAERGQDEASLLALAAGGFRDVTRVAASNPDIWLDIVDENRDAIADALGHFARRLDDVRDLVERRSRDELRAVFLHARDARRNLPGKLAEGDLYEVHTPIPDRPGVLAEVTTTVGKLGINIEDLQISHGSEGGRGRLSLAIVGREEAARVTAELSSRGYDAKATLV